MVHITTPASTGKPASAVRVVVEVEGRKLRLQHAPDAFAARRIATEWSRGYFGANPGRVIVFTRGIE